MILSAYYLIDASPADAFNNRSLGRNFNFLKLQIAIVFCVKIFFNLHFFMSALCYRGGFRWYGQITKTAIKLGKFVGPKFWLHGRTI